MANEFAGVSPELDIDIPGLINDPDFAALSEDRKRAILQSIGADQILQDAATGGTRAMLNAEISAAPPLERPIKMFPWLPDKTPQPSLPSVMQGVEAIPALGGGVGSVLGARLGAPVKGAAIGEGIGETGRQVIRKLLGYGRNPGVVSETLDLDPDSLTSRAVDVGQAVATGGTAEKVMNSALSKVPWLRTKARRTYANILDNTGQEKAIRSLEKTLIPIEDSLPVGTRGRIEREAIKRRALNQGPKEYYSGVDAEASYVPAYDTLMKEAEKQVATKPHQRPMLDEFGRQTFDPENTRIMEDVPATIRSPQTYDALRAEAKRLALMQRNASSFADRIGSKRAVSPEDVWEMRQIYGREAKALNKKAFSPGGDPTLKPVADAKEMGNKALSDILHSPEIDPMGKGKMADELWHAWSAVEEGSIGKDASILPIRWMLFHMMPGKLGAGAGYAAAAPSFWASLSAKTMRGIANAMENGAEIEAEHLLRAAINSYTAKKNAVNNKPLVSHEEM